MISELKAMKNMNPTVLTSLYPVALLLGQKTNPDGVHKMLNDIQLLEKLYSFDPYSVTSTMHKKLDKYVHNKDYTSQNISRFSVGCCFLAEWVIELHQIHAN